MERMFQDFWVQASKVLAACAFYLGRGGASFHVRVQLFWDLHDLWNQQCGENMCWGTEKPIHIVPVELSTLALSYINHPRHETCTSHLHHDLWNQIHEAGIKGPAGWFLSKSTTHGVPIRIQGTSENSSLNVAFRFGPRDKTEKTKEPRGSLEWVLCGGGGDRGCKKASWRVPIQNQYVFTSDSGLLTRITYVVVINLYWGLTRSPELC